MNHSRGGVDVETGRQSGGNAGPRDREQHWRERVDGPKAGFWLVVIAQARSSFWLPAIPSFAGWSVKPTAGTA